MNIYARGLHHDKAQHTRQGHLKQFICDLIAKQIAQYGATSAHQAGKCAQGKESLNIGQEAAGEHKGMIAVQKDDGGGYRVHDKRMVHLQNEDPD